MKRRRHFDSTTGKADWSTPLEVFSKLDVEFCFDLDPCAEAWNAKCQSYIAPQEDGLTRVWHGRVFVNPPYGHAIRQWVEKGYVESGLCKLVVMLLPARTDNQWWHKFVMHAKEVRLSEGRIYFLNRNGKPATNTSFGSALVIFDGKKHVRPTFRSWRPYP